MITVEEGKTYYFIPINKFCTIYSYHNPHNLNTRWCIDLEPNLISHTNIKLPPVCQRLYHITGTRIEMQEVINQLEEQNLICEAQLFHFRQLNNVYVAPGIYRYKSVVMHNGHDRVFLEFLQEAIVDCILGNYSIYKHHSHRCFGTYRINCFSDKTHMNYNQLYIGCKQLYQDEFAQALRAIYIAYPDLEAQLPIPLDELLSINQHKYELSNQVTKKI